MSMLKALHAATTLEAVRDILATQVLSVEDLATARESDLSMALSSQGAFASIWSVDDVADRFNGSRKEAAAWFAENSHRLGDILGQRGNDAIDDMLTGDGLSLDGDDDRAQAIEAGYTVNEKAPGQFVFNDPDGNDDDSLTSPYATEAEAWAAAYNDMD